MSVLLGHGIVILVLVGLVAVCVRQIAYDLKGGGCAGCSGNCAGCSNGSCGACRKEETDDQNDVEN